MIQLLSSQRWSKQLTAKSQRQLRLTHRVSAATTSSSQIYNNQIALRQYNSNDKEGGIQESFGDRRATSFVKFNVTSEDKVDYTPNEKQSYYTYDKSELSSAPSERNPLGLFQLKTKFSQRKTNPEATKNILPLITHELYNYQFYGRQNSDAQTWITHSGPPFANGSAHMGHFMNMVGKDVINRYKMM